MGLHHHHHHIHHKSKEEAGVKNVAFAFFLNLSFTVIEIVGGLYTNSMAILSDALHDLGDTMSLGMAWYFEKLSTKKANNIYTYGYGRFTVLGALINSIILLLGSFFIIYHAIPRLLHPEAVVARGMFLMSLLGIVFNGLAILKLNKKGSLNERVIYYHLLEDVLGWVVVLISSVFIYFYKIYWLDALLSIFIAIYIAYNAVKNLKVSIEIILQKTPGQYDLDLIKLQLEKLPHIQNVHDLHIWSMDDLYTVMSMHCKLDSNDISLEKLKQIKTSIIEDLEKIGIEHATVEFESPDETH